MKNNAFKAIGALLMLVGAAIMIYVRITHIDMTETRLLITAWREYLAVIVFVISGYFIFVNGEEIENHK